MLPQRLENVPNVAKIILFGRFKKDVSNGVSLSVTPPPTPSLPDEKVNSFNM